MEFSKLSVAKLKHLGKMMLLLPLAALALTATSCDDDNDSPTPGITETVKLNFVEATPDCFYFIPYLQQHGNYYIELATGPIGYSGIMAYPLNEGDYILAMDLYSWADADHKNPTIPGGIYTPTNNPNDEHDLTFSLTNTMLIYNAGKNEDGLSIVRFTKFTDGFIELSTNSDGTYTLNATLTGEDNKEYELSFGGPIEVLDMSAIEDEDWWGFSGNTEFTAKKSNYVYYDDSQTKGVDTYYLRLFESDKITGDYNHPNDQSNKINLCLYTQHDKGLAGTYTVRAEETAGSCYPGQRFAATATDSYVERITADWTPRYALISEGNITITENNGTYSVTVDCKTPEGTTVKATYTGQIENITGKAPSYSTLESDITVTPTQCSFVDYYGEYNGVYPFSVALANDTEVLFFDFVASSGSLTELPTGTYTINGTEDAGALIAGRVEDGLMYCTSYVKYNSDATEVVASTPASNGTLTITRSGDKYTFTFDLEDDAQPTRHTIKGSCAVTLPEFNNESGELESRVRKTRSIAVPKMKNNFSARILH